MRPTAVVTGAGRGIGAAIAKALAHDAWVAAIDKHIPDPEVAQVSLAVDVRDRARVNRAVAEIVQDRDGIDWLVCAAGVIRDSVSWKMQDEDWDEVMAVNLTGVFNMARAAVPYLRKSAQGRVVIISSINAIRGNFGQTNYAASKAGLIGLGRSLALELARDQVTVNVVAPGFIDTPMTEGLPQETRHRAIARTPLGRMGHPEEVAAVVRFLCSEQAGYVTGTVVPVDGGQLLGGMLA